MTILTRMTARPNDRVTDNALSFRQEYARRFQAADAVPADYLRAVKLRRIRRYTMAERVLLLAIASLVAALIIHLYRA